MRPDGTETRVDRLLGGRLSLRQSVTGHRAGTDALLVAAAVPVGAGDTVVDAGSGVGTIGLALALREPGCAVTLVEREPELATLAEENVGLNGFGPRVRVHQADLFNPDALRALVASADIVVSNPPFHGRGTVRHSPDAVKARAHGFGPDQGGDHGAWLRAMLRMARPHGRVVMIHRPEALGELLATADGRLGGLRVRPVLPRADEAAIRILVGGVVGSRAPLAILAPLVLHEADGTFSTLAQAMARGEALSPIILARAKKSRPRGPASTSS